MRGLLTRANCRELLLQTRRAWSTPILAPRHPARVTGLILAAHPPMHVRAGAAMGEPSHSAAYPVK